MMNLQKPAKPIRDRKITTLDKCPVDAEWRTISEFPGYEISEYGHVRRGDLIRRPSIKYTGYTEYNLWQDGKYHYRLAHRLVLFAFVGPPPTSKHQCAHWDGSTDNHHWSNLRWATAKENAADRIRHGTHRCGENHPRWQNAELAMRGEKHPLSKLNEQAVRAIRKSKESKRVLAKKYGVDRALIARVKQGKVWRHVI